MVNWNNWWSVRVLQVVSLRGKYLGLQSDNRIFIKGDEVKRREQITVIYKVNDQEKFKEEWQRIHSLFKQEDDLPFRIHSISLDDEMYRVSLIEEALGKYDDHFDRKEVIEDIISCADLSKWEWP